MSITSFYFLVLILVGTVVYYVIPKSWQWIELLVLSMIFYYYAASPITMLYLVASTVLAYVSTMYIGKFRSKSVDDDNLNIRNKAVFTITIISISLNVLIWFVLKGRDLWMGIVYRLLNHVSPEQAEYVSGIHLVAALGMGYYTLQVIGYIIDCYWGNIAPEKNILKLFLFVSYFPQLTTGPISRFNDLKSLYERHVFEYQNISFGAQRILWGFVKKLVLAERAGIIVSTITSEPWTYSGFYAWIAILLYPIQMYADFSGCMDIVLGTSELFGIKLAENFRNPFFARTSQEFWQRWHITLGSWAKDYVLYPLLKTKFMIKLGKISKKKFGKKTGKFIVNLVAMFVLWMVIGIWHGGLRYIVGVSLWYWVILMSGDLLSPYFAKLTKFFDMKTESFSWYLFQSARTYLIYAVGATFFGVSVTGGLRLINDALQVFYVKGHANPWIFFDDVHIPNAGTGDIVIIIISIVLLIIVGVLREKFGYARIWVQNQSFVFRWFIWTTLFVFVLILGKYGPEYNATDFIYQGF